MYVAEPASLWPFDDRAMDASKKIVCIPAKANRGYKSVQKYHIVTAANH